MNTADRTLDAPDLACIDLTLLIASTMPELQPGEVLEVRADDPAARTTAGHIRHRRPAQDL